MNKSALIIIVAVLVLVVAAILIFRGSGKGPETVQPGTASSAVEQTNPSTNSVKTEDTPVNSQAVQGGMMITYTDTGFSPSSLTIKNGQTVAFKNESAGDMWVASAPHPTHTDYPEFDAKKAYKSGESYSFTFNKVGTWKFHNHAKPTNFGSVTVE